MMANLLIATAVALLAAVPSGTPRNCDLDLDTWLSCNNPRVVSYLSKLTRADTGKVLGGVTLTDGRKVLNGVRFVGKVAGVPTGIHIYLVETHGNRSAFLWVDPGAPELPLPSCPSRDYEETAIVLSTDVYTWKAAQPGHGVIEVRCAPDAWVQAARNLTRR